LSVFADFLAGGTYDAHLRRMRRTFQENLVRMTRAVEASFPAETKVSRPAGGFVLWLELPRRFDSRALFDEALAHGICFAPGDVFSASRRNRNCLRLSAGYAWSDRIEGGVRRLGHLAQQLLARQPQYMRRRSPDSPPDQIATDGWRGRTASQRLLSAADAVSRPRDRARRRSNGPRVVPRVYDGFQSAADIARRSTGLPEASRWPFKGFEPRFAVRWSNDSWPAA
jgi:hypothetical protein